MGESGVGPAHIEVRFEPDSEWPSVPSVYLNGRPTSGTLRVGHWIGPDREWLEVHCLLTARSGPAETRLELPEADVVSAIPGRRTAIYWEGEPILTTNARVEVSGDICTLVFEIPLAEGGAPLPWSSYTILRPADVAQPGRAVVS